MRPIHLAILGLVFNLALLLPGLLLPVLTVSGKLEPEGIAKITPTLLETGVSVDAIKSFKPLLNPIATRLIGDDEALKRELVKRLTPKIIESLTTAAPQIEVYSQSRSILGSIGRLFEVHSYLAASLILIFSVFVPLGKLAFVLRALNQSDLEKRRRTLSIVTSISKWSMADVFAVALFITFLAARASQTAPGPDQPPPLVTFTASFGTGFYFFAAYCVCSLAINQFILRKLTASTTV